MITFTLYDATGTVVSNHPLKPQKDQSFKAKDYLSVTISSPRAAFHFHGTNYPLRLKTHTFSGGQTGFHGIKAIGEFMVWVNVLKTARDWAWTAVVSPKEKAQQGELFA